MLILVLFITFFSGSNVSGMLLLMGVQPAPESKIVTIEIRYYAPGAGVVDFIWGIDGWQVVPEELQMEGSSVENGVTLTPMQREDKTFVAEIRVPAGSSVQYRFAIKETIDGMAVDNWDSGTDPEGGSMPVQPVLVASYDKVFRVDASVNPNTPVINQVFLYRHPEAEAAILVWGINGWQLVPEAVNATDTVISGDYMNTKMLRRGDNFQTSIQIPKGSVVQYGFSFSEGSKRGDSEPEWTWGGEHFLLANEDGAVEVVKYEASPSNLLLAKYWPLLLIGIITAMGILIGFRK